MDSGKANDFRTTRCSESGCSTLPLIFASNALAPVENMRGWKQTITSINPRTCAIGNVHELMLEGTNWTVIGSAVAVSVAFDS